MKVCSKCLKDKNDDEMSRHNRCLMCAAEYRRLYLQSHPTQRTANIVNSARIYLNRRRDRHAFIQSLKIDPCKDCGIAYHPYVMDFDHIGTDKVCQISNMTGFSEANILAEIAKCDLVCANCHRMRTFRRSQPAPIAQLEEQRPCNAQVIGSNPIRGS